MPDPARTNGPEALPATGLDILVVDDEANIRKTLSMALEVEGHAVVSVSNGPDGLLQASRRPFDLVFLDLRLGTAKGTDYIPQFIASSPWIKVVVITAYASVETAVEAIKRGAVEYLPKPFTPAQVKAIVDRAADTRTAEAKVTSLRRDDAREPGIDLDSRSTAMQQALTLTRKAAPTSAAVLLRGGSGTGKSVLARLIHAWSGRSSGAFGAVSCPALSGELLESEIFGHVKEAFPGALRDHLGRLSALEGGTLFLDEVGELPLSVQPNLLRLLDDGTYERMGEGIARRADVRILAASSLDLEDLVRSGRFREDLLFRLNAFRIDLPALRDRREDIPVLSHRFLAWSAGRLHRQFLGFTDEAMDALKGHGWPGNIRELRGVIERAAILASGTEITVSDLGLAPRMEADPIRIGAAVTLEKVEEAHIRQVLASSKSLEEAARILGIDAATLWRRRKRYGIG